MERDPLTRDFVRYRTAGDAAALARVFDGTAPHLLKIARHLLRDRALAEDAVSNAYLAAVECAAEFDDARPILPWLPRGRGRLRGRRAIRAGQRSALVPLGGVRDPRRDTHPPDAVGVLAKRRRLGRRRGDCPFLTVPERVLAFGDVDG